MNIPTIIEKWDGVLFQIYNFLQSLKFLFFSLKIKKIIKRNKAFKNKHLGERCFIVLNGPSINSHNLSFLENEVVFASNYFYRSNLCSIVKPDYYCWLDSKIFKNKEYEAVFLEIDDACPNAKVFINSKGFIGDTKENYYYTYNRHIPNYYSLKTNISGVCSNFATVALYALSIAIYMGFKKIYFLGLDFEPGAFKHFTNLGDKTECSDPKRKKSKVDVFGNYWSYAKSHSEFYKISEIAKRKGIEIYNLNSNSCIRSFEFSDFDSLFN